MELDQAKIEESIIAKVADDIVRDDDLYDRVRRAVDTRIDKIFTEAATKSIEAAVTEAIKAGFDREYSRVTAYGERVGAPTTIRKELEKLIAGYWNGTVDRSGKPSTSYGDKVTRAEWTMMQMVAKDFNDGMKQHVVDLGGSLKDGLRRELHETVNRLLSEVFHVRSADDQRANRRDQSIIHPKEKAPTP